jgi:transcriptional regulator with XRE-family HTH domain
MNKFSTRLKQALVYRNMKPIELAEKTGIGKSSISDWLKGKYEAKQDKILLIAEALAINEGFLLGLEVPMVPEHSQLMDVYTQLNKTRQAKVYSFAEKQLAEQNNTVVKIPSREEMTLAAHAADPNQLFTEEEISKIHDYLDELDAKHEGKRALRKQDD